MYGVAQKSDTVRRLRRQQQQHKEELEEPEKMVAALSLSSNLWRVAGGKGGVISGKVLPDHVTKNFISIKGKKKKLLE